MISLIVYVCIVQIIILMQSLNIPLKIINQSRDEKSLKMLADFIFIKTIYSNSCLYKASYSNLSRKTGFSRTKITKLIKYFKSKGWAREHSNNIILSWNKKDYRVFHKIKFITQVDIINQLNFILLSHKELQCKYANKLRKDRSNPAKLAELKRAIAHEKKFRYKGAICDSFVLSVKGAAKVFNCSKSTANEILLSLEGIGMIKMDRCKKFVRKATLEMFKYFVPPKSSVGSFWYFKGGIYNALPNTILLTEGSKQDKLIRYKSRR